MSYLGHCFCPKCLSVHLSFTNLCPLTSTPGCSFRELGTNAHHFETVCVMCESMAWVKAAPWGERSDSSILCPLSNPSTPGGIFRLLWTKCSQYWDDMQRTWIIDLGSRSQSHHALKGYKAVFGVQAVLCVQCMVGVVGETCFGIRKNNCLGFFIFKNLLQMFRILKRWTLYTVQSNQVKVVFCFWRSHYCIKCFTPCLCKPWRDFEMACWVSVLANLVQGQGHLKTMVPQQYLVVHTSLQLLMRISK